MSLLATCLKLLKYRCLGQQTCKKRCKNNGCKQYQTVASTIAVWLAEVQKVALGCVPTVERIVKPPPVRWFLASKNRRRGLTKTCAMMLYDDIYDSMMSYLTKGLGRIYIYIFLLDTVRKIKCQVVFLTRILQNTHRQQNQQPLWHHRFAKLYNKPPHQSTRFPPATCQIGAYPMAKPAIYEQSRIIKVYYQGSPETKAVFTVFTGWTLACFGYAYLLA